MFAALEENSVTLSTMKASKFFLVFETDISYWEKTLAHISETVEMILQACGLGGPGGGGMCWVCVRCFARTSS